MVHIACDVGRAAVKVAWVDGAGAIRHFELPSIVSTHYNALNDPTSALVNSFSEGDVASMSVLGTQSDWLTDFSTFFLFGKQALRQGSHVMAFSEGSQYHRFGVAVLLYCVARVLSSTSLSCSEVSLGINLTFNNKEAAPFYSRCLKGAHTVSIGVSNKGQLAQREVAFSIDSLLCFAQGYCSIFNFVKDNTSPVFAGKGLIVDIGRYTVDLSLVEAMTLVSGQSYDYGSTKLLEAMKNLVSPLALSYTDLEGCFSQRGRSFRNLQGVQVNPWDLLVNSGGLDNYYTELRMLVLNFVGDTPLDYVILVGGGAHLIGDRFKKDFPAAFLDVDPVRANALGMLNLLIVE